MDRHQLATLAVIGGAGGALAWWLTQGAGPGVYSPINLDLALGGDPGALQPDSATLPLPDYLAQLSAAEDPSGDPYAKNPYSTASGLYQFTKATWTSLGGDWGPDPTRAFGGLTPSPAEQTAMAQRLTAGNASLLDRAGQAINSATLYAAHIFGAGSAVRVLGADPATPLANLVGASTVAKNPALGSTVASFLDYLARKVGGNG
jgi:hypothetical protein